MDKKQKQKSSRNVTKDNKRLSLGQFKIMQFFEKSILTNSINKNNTSTKSLECNSSLKKRKVDLEEEMSSNIKPDFKLRKIANIKENKITIMESSLPKKENIKLATKEVIQENTNTQFADLNSKNVNSKISPKKGDLKTNQNNVDILEISCKETSVLKITKVANSVNKKKISKNNSLDSKLQNEWHNGEIQNNIFDDKEELNFTHFKENDKCNKNSTEEINNLIGDNAKTLEKSKNEIISDFDMGDFFDDDWCGDVKIEADLSSYKRCQVLNVEYHTNETLVTVKEVDSEGEALVKCRQFWREIKLKNGQICTVKAKKISEEWIIDNCNGFLINDPDMLLAGTTIVNGLFCSRRSVLQEIYNGINSLPHYEANLLTLTTGVISHEVMQEALQKKIYTLPGITEIYNRKMKTNRTLNVLYENNVSLTECHEHTKPYLNHIHNFIKIYIKGKTVPNNKSLKCSVESIHDIEENIWLPKLGMKGKIDITAEVNIHSRRKIMPIEIKTGKPSFSLEHKGQVILYILMMKLTGRDVDSGLLLYLKDNIMQEIKASHQEIRDLVLLRNNLTYYFKNKLQNAENMNEDKSAYYLNLPEPINHPACKQCPFNTLCCVYLSKDERISLSETHYLKSIMDEVLNQFTSDHIEYVLKWTIMLQLEQAAETLACSQSDAWTINPETREKRGTCISNLKVIGKVVERNEKFLHVFTRQNNINDIDFKLLEFSEEEYVIVSTNNRVNIASGYIKTIESNTVTLSLNKNIATLFSYDIFHIDKYGSSSLIAFNNYVNVGGLLDDHESCSRLRNIIIDRKPATFLKELPSAINEIILNYSASLNAYQRKAIIKVITANDYVLIKGMPGTGKTQTLIVLIEILVKLGKSILITAHTNTAVDNILLKLLNKNIDFLRLGSSTKINSSLYNKSETVASANCKTPEELHAMYCSKNIVAVTCYSASHAHLTKRIFDICIVDESTQVLQPTLLRPLYSCLKFVLVGDPKQLPPIAKSNEARKLGLNESLFERLDTDNNTVSLRAQYRMNSRIMDVANKLTYNDNLIAANKEIANATLKIKNPSAIRSSEKWIQEVLSQKLEDSAIIIDTTPTWTMDLEKYTNISNKAKEFCCNLWEISIIIRLVETLIKLGTHAQEIGVISPYRAQVACLKRNMSHGVEINTVDQYQGRDKEIIIYSCTKSIKASCSIKEFDLLQDHSRLNVAVTRAKHKLILVCDKLCLDRFTPFKKLFKSVKGQHIITVKDGEKDFDWKSLMKSVKF